MAHIYLGLDTSNYRTSVAAVSSEGEILFSRAELLEVKRGDRGLRQSEAFFAHSNRLPDYISGLFSDVRASDVEAIGVSERPRRVEGSYMPCFLAGTNAAGVLGPALGVPVYGFSHQEGHAAAVLGGISDELLFMHLSGGTTEFLVCSPDDDGYDMRITGGSRDISFGQLIDRTGVALGFPFPSGPYLDEAACSALEAHDYDPGSFRKHRILPHARTEDGWFNLSGAETRLLRYIEKGTDSEEIPLLSAELFVFITDLLIRSAEILTEKHGLGTVCMAGGVASGKAVRKLIENTEHSPGILFGDPQLSGDNAVGTALLARRKHETGKRITGK